MSYKVIPLKPWTGPWDTRSMPDAMPPMSFRKRVNWMIREDSLSPRDGFVRCLQGVENQDLHDQLTPMCGADSETETITFLKEITSTWGQRYLLAGTRSRLYQLNESTGDWRVLAYGMASGAPKNSSVRWKAAQVLNVVTLTNGYDEVMTYTIDDPPDATTHQTLKEIEDLQTLGVERAGCVASFKDVVLLGDITENGVRYEDAIMWPMRFKPTEYDPASQSFVNMVRLGGGHRVLAIEPFGDFFHVYTDKGIFRGQATGDPDSPFSFSTFYEDRSGQRCLVFPNTLVNTGDKHVWLSRDAIYYVDAYTAMPERMDWTWLCDNTIFNSINKRECHSHVAGYWPDRNEVHIFWTEGTATAAYRGVALDMLHGFASELNYGASACCVFRSDDRISFREWLMQSCVCDTADITGMLDMESVPETFSGCDDSTITAVYSLNNATIDGQTTEDWLAVAYGQTGTFAGLEAVKDLQLDAICAQCNEEQSFLIAYSGCVEGASLVDGDNCIKECGVAYHREIYTGPTTSGYPSTAYRSAKGTSDRYAQLGYIRTLITSPMHFGAQDEDKNIKQFTLEAWADDSAGDSVVSLSVGTSYNPLDPSLTECGFLWTNPVNKRLKCRNASSNPTYKRNLTVPAAGIDWALYASGRWIAFKIEIGDLSVETNIKSQLTLGKGGACKISGALATIRKK